jgi:hypothetical protein
MQATPTGPWPASMRRETTDAAHVFIPALCINITIFERRRLANNHNCLFRRPTLIVETDTACMAARAFNAANYHRLSCRCSPTFSPFPQQPRRLKRAKFVSEVTGCAPFRTGHHQPERQCDAAVHMIFASMRRKACTRQQTLVPPPLRCSGQN